MVTRGSPLALLQAEEVAVRLRGLGAEVKVVPMRTEGDRRAAARLVEIVGKGLFGRELEQAHPDPVSTSYNRNAIEGLGMARSCPYVPPC